MAWDSIHRSVGSNGQVTMTPGSYWYEQFTLGNNVDASTSKVPFSANSDITILMQFSRVLNADTYVQVEHSADGTIWFKQGNIEEDASVDHDDISKDISKIAALDISIIDSTEGVMMFYDIDSHGASPLMRFTVKANGTDESSNIVKAYLIPHF